jgi:hypothetical protein
VHLELRPSLRLAIAAAAAWRLGQLPLPSPMLPPQARAAPALLLELQPCPSLRRLQGAAPDFRLGQLPLPSPMLPPQPRPAQAPAELFPVRLPHLRLLRVPRAAPRAAPVRGLRSSVLPPLLFLRPPRLPALSRLAHRPQPRKAPSHLGQRRALMCRTMTSERATPMTGMGRSGARSETPRQRPPLPRQALSISGPRLPPPLLLGRSRLGRPQLLSRRAPRSPRVCRQAGRLRPLPSELRSLRAAAVGRLPLGRRRRPPGRHSLLGVPPRLWPRRRPRLRPCARSPRWL